MNSNTNSPDCQSNCERCGMGKEDRAALDPVPTNRLAHPFTGPSLNEVLAYENPSVIYRLVTKDGYAPAEAAALFEDVKRFLFLSSVTTGSLAPTKRIDDAWHAFILHTRDYSNFCKEFFGSYIHHVPNPPGAPKGDGSMLKRTQELAAMTFGTLSNNWSVRTRGFSPEVCVGGFVETGDPRKSMAPVNSEDCQTTCTMTSSTEARVYSHSVTAPVDSEECSPLTNCEAPPADCALNRDFTGVVPGTVPAVSGNN